MKENDTRILIYPRFRTTETHGPISANVDELPMWVQERVAILNLLNDGEESPIGVWRGQLLHFPTKKRYYIDMTLGDLREWRLWKGEFLSGK